MMQTHQQAMASLRALLGDAHDASQLFSYAQRVQQDEAQTYPQAALDSLSDWGLQAYYVPQQFGGKATRYDFVGELLASVASRDLAVGVSHAISLLGSVPVWLAGNEAQQRELAAGLLQKKRICLALTEPGHGSDLLGMQTKGQRVGQHYVLNGEKWLINGALRNDYLSVFTRTSEAGGPKGFSFFCLDRSQLAPANFSTTPKNPTLGVRGSEIAGFTLQDCLVDEASRIGAEGSGFETTLKSLQISRTFCGSLSLGAWDTGLRVVLGFALQRKISGKTVSAMAQSQRLLCEAWADGLIGHAVTDFALRALHVKPEQASVHSAIVKYFVPTMVEHAFQKMSVVLGARYYLREAHQAGIFQKMFRDQLLISLFDGSTQVNLYTLSFQLRPLLNRAALNDTSAVLAIARVDQDLPPFEIQKLRIATDGSEILGQSLLALCRQTSEQIGMLAPFEQEAQTMLAAFVAFYQKLIEDVKQLPVAAFHQGEPIIFDLAHRYTVVAAIAAVLSQIHANRDSLQDYCGQAPALLVILHRLHQCIASIDPLPGALYQQAFEILAQRHQKGKPFNLSGH